MLYLPAARDEVDSVATPEEFRDPVPNTAEPFMNLTGPVNNALSPPFTVAVRVSACPAVRVFADAATLVVVDWVATVTETADELLVREPILPIYLAVRLCVPEARELALSVATPEEFNEPVPSEVEPLKNVTIPPGTMVVPFTVADRVTVSPGVD
jgi:hypothetical protein